MPQWRLKAYKVLHDRASSRASVFARRLRSGGRPMLLQRGEIRNYDFDRMTVNFTMLNREKVVLCAISTAAMDEIEHRRDVSADQRIDQFMRLRDLIEERASRKFDEQGHADRPVVLRTNDFDH